MCKNGGMLSALKSTLVLLSLFLLLILPSTVLAVGETVTNANYKAPQNANYTLQNLFHAGLCELVGMSPLSLAPNDLGKCVGSTSDGQLKAYNSVPGGGALGTLASLTGNMYNPPTSTTYYLANLGRDIGIVDSVYAQSVTGSGANLIQPIEALWRVVRNFSYIIFTLIFLTVGFMIMLRKKLNPQTVITIQTALPGLVVGLFLVTFSYFLTALIIDISFLGIPLIANLFAQSAMPSIFANPSPQQAQNYQNLASNSNIFELFGSTAGNVKDNTFNFSGTINDFLNSTGAAPAVRTLTTAIGIIAGAILFFGPAAPLAAIVGGGIGFVAPDIISLLIPFILIIALFIQMLRLFLSLLKSYITILVLAVLSPLLITFGSLPGKGGTITFWWKTILANTLVFPAVFAAILFAGVIIAPSVNAWGSTPPLFGNLNTGLIQIIIGYGIILGTPAIPDLVRNLLGVKDVPGIQQSATAGALAGFAVGRGSLSRAYGTTMKGTGVGEAREWYRRDQATKRAAEWKDIKGWRRRALNWLP